MNTSEEISQPLTTPPDSDQNPTSLNHWITVTSITLIITGIASIIISRTMSDGFWYDILFGLGLALAPSGALGLIFDWLVFGQLIQSLRQNTVQLSGSTKQLTREVGELKISTDFLKQSSNLGLEMIYADRGEALNHFVEYMAREAKNPEGKLLFVGSSVKGLLENVSNLAEIIRTAIGSKCDLRILLTHPEYSLYRENQEDRPPVRLRMKYSRAFGNSKRQLTLNILVLYTKICTIS